MRFVSSDDRQGGLPCTTAGRNLFNQGGVNGRPTQLKHAIKNITASPGYSYRLDLTVPLEVVSCLFPKLEPGFELFVRSDTLKGLRPWLNTLRNGQTHILLKER